jgi:outer membrane immunogenic protein
MKKYSGFLLATAGGFAAASGAQAADLPVKAPVYNAPPMVSWEGWYAGLHAGANWQRTTTDNPYLAVAGISSATEAGFIGGGQIGHNWQTANWVYGLEADISGLTGSASASNTGYSLSGKVRWLSTFRGRFGTTLGGMGDTIIYATGGLAVGGVDNTAVAFSSYSVSKTKFGWTAGGGIEHMLNPHWTVGAEALFVDLGSSTSGLPFSGASPAKITSFKNTLAIARLKFNYRW